MNKLILKLLIALLISVAILVSPGWIKDISIADSDSAKKGKNSLLNINRSDTGITVEYSLAVNFASKYATVRHEQFH